MNRSFSPNANILDADVTLFYGFIIKRNFRSSAVTVSNTPTKIPTTPLVYRTSLIIQNVSNNTVYLGASNVDSTSGFPLLPTAVISFTIEDNVDVYGYASSSSELRIIEGS